MDVRMNNQKLAKEYREKLVGKKFKHFKGNIYKVIEVGIHSEDAGCMVIYHTDSDESLVWVRPLEMFLSEVDKNKYPDVEQKYRFELISE